ncbi:MAG: hypothetical protein AVDCRST_MAG59-74, partial [uncultured Thermomicrobiales bacterium]
APAPVRRLPADLRLPRHPSLPDPGGRRARPRRRAALRAAGRGARLRRALGGRPPDARQGRGDPRGVDGPRRARRGDDPAAARDDPHGPLLPAPGLDRQDGRHPRPALRRPPDPLPRRRLPEARVRQLRPLLAGGDGGPDRRPRRGDRADPEALDIRRPGNLRGADLGGDGRRLRPEAAPAPPPAPLVRRGRPRRPGGLRPLRPGLEHHARPPAGATPPPRFARRRLPGGRSGHGRDRAEPGDAGADRARHRRPPHPARGAAGARRRPRPPAAGDPPLRQGLRRRPGEPRLRRRRDRRPARGDGQRLDRRHPGRGRRPARRLRGRGHLPFHALVHGRPGAGRDGAVRPPGAAAVPL